MPAPLAPTVQPPPETKREPEQPSVQHIIDTRKPSEQIRKEPEISPRLTVQLNPQTKQELEQSHVKRSANTQASFEQLASSPLIASNTNPGVTQEPLITPEPVSVSGAHKQRVAVLKQYWHHFDEIHARQVEGMKPLRSGQIINPLSVGFEHPFP